MLQMFHSEFSLIVFLKRCITEQNRHTGLYIIKVKTSQREGKRYSPLSEHCKQAHKVHHLLCTTYTMTVLTLKDDFTGFCCG